MAIKDKTEDFSSKTMEDTLAKLAEYLGTTDLDMIKMFSILSAEGVRKKAMMLGDIKGYKYCRRLKFYAFEDLFLNISKDGIGRQQVVEIAKTPFQIGDQQEKGRLRRVIGDLFH